MLNKEDFYRNYKVTGETTDKIKVSTLLPIGVSDENFILWCEKNLLLCKLTISYNEKGEKLLLGCKKKSSSSKREYNIETNNIKIDRLFTDPIPSVPSVPSDSLQNGRWKKTHASCWKIYCPGANLMKLWEMRLKLITKFVSSKLDTVDLVGDDNARCSMLMLDKKVTSYNILSNFLPYDYAEKNKILDILINTEGTDITILFKNLDENPLITLCELFPEVPDLPTVNIKLIYFEKMRENKRNTLSSDPSEGSEGRRTFPPVLFHSVPSGPSEGSEEVKNYIWLYDFSSILLKGTEGTEGWSPDKIKTYILKLFENHVIKDITIYTYIVKVTFSKLITNPLDELSDSSASDLPVADIKTYYHFNDNIIEKSYGYGFDDDEDELEDEEDE